MRQQRATDARRRRRSVILFPAMSRAFGGELAAFRIWPRFAVRSGSGRDSARSGWLHWRNRLHSRKHRKMAARRSGATRPLLNPGLAEPARPAASAAREKQGSQTIGGAACSLSICDRGSSSGIGRHHEPRELAGGAWDSNAIRQRSATRRSTRPFFAI
jgi:hypothetical protein